MTTGTDTCAACGHTESERKFRFGVQTLMACRECGSTRLSPLPDEETLAHFYDSEYAIVAESSRTDVLLRARTYRDTPWVVRMIRRHHPTARRVAEVGCAYGYLLWGLREAGFDVEGFELSATTAAVGREALGLPIQHRSLPLPGSGFDVIVMRHVLEHFRDPVSALAILVSALAPGGLLVLATPNVASIAARAFGREWEWITPPAHLHLFTLLGLRRAQERAGLDVIDLWTRRGDARPFAFGALRWIAARTGAKAALSARVGTFGPDSIPPEGGGGGTARMKRWSLGALRALDVVLHPLWWWAWKAGMGEEMWSLARRPSS